jgi:anti-sigma28 factor (negative regulator of flagellin synthesis)
VHKVLYGTPAKPGFQVSEQRVAKIKEQIYKPEYKTLREQIAKI